MKLDIYSYMGGSIYWSGFHHINESIYLNKVLNDGMTFIDIGANQGELTLFASLKIKSGKIMSFEPVHENFSRLHMNIALNQLHQCESFNFGLSDSNSELPIYTDSTSNIGGINEGLSTLFQSESKNHFQETIKLKVFDELFLDNLNRLDFIKMDIEGSELFALKGMRKSIEKFKPEILIEINEECFAAAGYSSSDITNFFNDLGYTAYKIHRGNLVPQTTDFTIWGNYIYKYN